MNGDPVLLFILAMLILACGFSAACAIVEWKLKDP